MIIKSIFYGIYMLIMRIKGIKHSYIKRVKGQEYADEYARKTEYRWAEYTIKTIGIELEVDGLENIPDEPCLFVGNHTSILDVPIMLYTIDRLIGFVAKKEILKIPVLGSWLEKAHCIPLDRENPREALKTINNGIELLKQGYSIAIFPEGTRSKDGKLGEFKKGSLKLATKSKVPIIPVAVKDAYNSFEKERKFKPSKIKVSFGKPVYTNVLTRDEEKELNENIRAVIAELLQK